MECRNNLDTSSNIGGSLELAEALVACRDDFREVLVKGEATDLLNESVYIRAGNGSSQAFNESSVLLERGILVRLDGEDILKFADKSARDS